MPFTHEDYERQFGPGWPDFYTTPADWSKCKNLNLEGATPCWHPHCDCQPTQEKSTAFDFDKFLKILALWIGGGVLLVTTLICAHFLGVF
ncbi:hypothetical protein IVB12_15605 [Bradyrhizobium sp. 179]|uniref:hypothetical protein n=1 Tax=Bradyrhizobium sp. 179 TaxID=2782648 RepID=UPI001FF75FAC|nr:hypothetical protein [Bradyrhizobium sp. 179]MCK1543341.1 hypothetical protein [Bradyrhizobium sp. 179]